jgi:hypothetical protein
MVGASEPAANGKVNSMNLKHVLRKVETDRGNVHGWVALLIVASGDDHVMALRCREWARPPHQSRHLLERIEDESFWLRSPGFADVLVRG